MITAEVHPQARARKAAAAPILARPIDDPLDRFQRAIVEAHVNRPTEAACRRIGKARAELRNDENKPAYCVRCAAKTRREKVAANMANMRAKKSNKAT